MKPEEGEPERAGNGIVSCCGPSRHTSRLTSLVSCCYTIRRKRNCFFLVGQLLASKAKQSKALFLWVLLFLKSFLGSEELGSPLRICAAMCTSTCVYMNYKNAYMGCLIMVHYYIIIILSKKINIYYKVIRISHD